MVDELPESAIGPMSRALDSLKTDPERFLRDNASSAGRPVKAEDAMLGGQFQADLLTAGSFTQEQVAGLLKEMRRRDTETKLPRRER